VMDQIDLHVADREIPRAAEIIRVVLQREPQHVPVESNRPVEVGHRQHDMIEA